MLFSLSTLVALGASLSAVAAAPTPAGGPQLPNCSGSVQEIGFQGADAASAFTVSVCTDGSDFAVGHDYLSISRITYDTSFLSCTFHAEFDNSGAANEARYVCGDAACSFLNVGPPQVVYSVACTD